MTTVARSGAGHGGRRRFGAGGRAAAHGDGVGRVGGAGGAGEEVRVPLVEREGRGLRLTASGEAYASYARAILGLHEEAMAAARGDRDPERGRVRVAAVTTAGAHPPAALATFVDQHPGVDLRLEVGTSERIWELFAAHEVDLLIGAGRRGTWTTRWCARCTGTCWWSWRRRGWRRSSTLAGRGG